MAFFLRQLVLALVFVLAMKFFEWLFLRLKTIHDLHRLMRRVTEFQYSRFPCQTLDGKLIHLVKEAVELRCCNGEDPSEFADVLLLLLGAADLKGMTLSDIIRAGHSKMDINEKREWLPADSNGCFHHKP
jgi:hypothetical protein